MTVPCYNITMRKTITAVLLTLLLATPAFAALTPLQAKKVWSEVAPAAGFEELPFYCKASITPNAWVSSGKAVTVTTGLLKILDTEDELYGVLAHEAGHIKLNHHGKTIGRQVGRSLLSSVLTSLVGGVTGYAANVGVSLVSAGYSREQEIEADDYAVNLAAGNGKNPAGLYNALYKLSKYHKTEGSGFNSHPPDDRRLLHIKNTIKKLSLSGITSDKTFAAHQKAREETETANRQNTESATKEQQTTTE